MDLSYWQKQASSKPLFPDIEWSKPERRDQAGKLAIVGGNKLGFSAVAEAFQTATDTGVGQTKTLLPDCLKSSVPKTLDGVVFAPCNTSGSLNADAKPELDALAAWADLTLLVGDAGRSSETAILYEQFVSGYQGPLVVTRDAIDLVKNNPSLIVDRDETMLVASFAQLQKLFHGVHYPKILTFSMQLLQLVEALHKFTITYPCIVVTLHKDQLIIAHQGKIVTQEWHNAMAIWRGSVATKAASYWLWQRSKPLEAVTASIA